MALQLSRAQIYVFYLQIPEFSSSLMTMRPDWKKPAVHSTTQEMAMGWSPRPQGRNFQSHWSLISEGSPELSGFSPTVTFRKRLSTVQDLENSSEQEEPHSDHLAAEEEPRMSTSLNKEQHQKTEALQAMSWPRNSGMPGISDVTCRKRRDPKKRAAAVGLLLPTQPCPQGVPCPYMFPSYYMGDICLPLSGSTDTKYGGVHKMPTSVYEVTRPSSFSDTQCSAVSR